MITIIIEYIASLVESIIAANFLIGYNGVKENRNKYVAFFVTCFSFFSCISIFNFFTYFESLYGVSYIIILFICCMIFMEGRIIEKFFSSSLSIAFIVLINFTTLSAFSYIFNTDICNLIEERNIIRVMVLFFTKFLYFLVCQFLLMFRRRISNHLSIVEWLIITIIFMITMVISLIILNIAYKHELTTREYLLLYASALGVIIINIVAFYLFIVLNKQNRQILQLNGLKIHMEQHKKSLDELRTLSIEMHRIKHDTSKFIDVTHALLSDGKIDKAIQYLDELRQTALNEGYQIITTSNDVVNAVLNLKLSQCRKNNIDFRYQVTADLLEFPDLELSILLGNLLDNAIEGTADCDNPYVKIDISENRAYLRVFVTNSISMPIMKNNPKLKTTKSDNINHGLGILSIEDIVNKYDGMLDFVENSTEFSADIWLKRPKKMEYILDK